MAKPQMRDFLLMNDSEEFVFNVTAENEASAYQIVKQHMIKEKEKEQKQAAAKTKAKKKRKAAYQRAKERKKAKEERAREELRYIKSQYLALLKEKEARDPLSITLRQLCDIVLLEREV